MIEALLTSVMTTVVFDPGVSDKALLDVLLLLQSSLFSDEERTKIFGSLLDRMAHKLTMTLLLWESRGVMTAAFVGPYNKGTGIHTTRYVYLQVSSVSNNYGKSGGSMATRLKFVCLG